MESLTDEKLWGIPSHLWRFLLIILPNSSMLLILPESTNSSLLNTQIAEKLLTVTKCCHSRLISWLINKGLLTASTECTFNSWLIMLNCPYELWPIEYALHGCTISILIEEAITHGLVVQRHHLTAYVPERLRAIVRRVHTCSFGVDSAHLSLVISEGCSKGIHSRAGECDKVPRGFLEYNSG